MFRFTIRDVLWLMVVVALAVALWVERSRCRQSVAASQRAVAEAQETSVEVTQLNISLWNALDDKQQASFKQWPGSKKMPALQMQPAPLNRP
jgi:hypothetical protein